MSKRNQILVEQLNKIKLKKDIDQLISENSTNSEFISDLLEVCLSTLKRPSEKSSWILKHSLQKEKDLCKNVYHKLFEILAFTKSDPTIRNILSVINDHKIPDNYESTLIDFCIKELSNPNKPIAVHVYAAHILVNLIKKHPLLKNEVLLSINQQQLESRPYIKKLINKF
jgi:hypothetical protein